MIRLQRDYKRSIKLLMQRTFGSVRNVKQTKKKKKMIRLRKNYKGSIELLKTPAVWEKNMPLWDEPKSYKGSIIEKSYELGKVAAILQDVSRLIVKMNSGEWYERIIPKKERNQMGFD